MAIVLKDKSGNYLTRPVSHPATDEQVKEQLKVLASEGFLESNANVVKLMDEMYGFTPTVPKFNWQIGQIDYTSGAITSDTQNMRIAVSLVEFDCAAILKFPITSTYQYILCVYLRLLLLYCLYLNKYNHSQILIYP